MPGPYFKSQIPCVCGCYYPDVTRVRDEGNTRVFYCIFHGEIIAKNDCGFSPIQQEIPTDEWREKERERIGGRLFPITV